MWISLAAVYVQFSSRRITEGHGPNRASVDEWAIYERDRELSRLAALQPGNQNSSVEPSPGLVFKPIVPPINETRSRMPAKPR